MSTATPAIKPAAGCSPDGGLPHDCQGRRAESHGGSGKEAARVAASGNPEFTGAAAKQVFCDFTDIERALAEMYDLIAIHPDQISLKQFWFNCERLEAQLKELKASAVIHLENDFPAFVRGYKDIPE